MLKQLDEHFINRVRVFSRLNQLAPEGKQALTDARELLKGNFYDDLALSSE